MTMKKCIQKEGHEVFEDFSTPEVMLAILGKVNGKSIIFPRAILFCPWICLPWQLRPIRLQRWLNGILLHVVCVGFEMIIPRLHVRDVKQCLYYQRPRNYGILVIYLTQHPCPISLSESWIILWNLSNMPYIWSKYCLCSVTIQSL